MSLRHVTYPSPVARNGKGPAVSVPSLFEPLCSHGARRDHFEYAIRRYLRAVDYQGRRELPEELGADERMRRVDYADRVRDLKGEFGI